MKKRGSSEGEVQSCFHARHPLPVPTLSLPKSSTHLVDDEVHAPDLLQVRGGLVLPHALEQPLAELLDAAKWSEGRGFKVQAKVVEAGMQY